MSGSSPSVPSRRRPAARTGLGCALLAMALGCSPAEPPPTSGPSPSPPPATRRSPSSPAATPAPEAAAPPPPASGEPARAPAWRTLELDIGEIPQELTGQLLEAVTDGQAVIWSGAAAADTDGAPDLFRYAPGGAAPEVIFDNPDRDSSLLPIAAAGGRYVFSEVNARLYGELGWGLWYLPEPHAEPIELDRFDSRSPWRSPYPGIVIEAERIVWTAWHPVDGALHSQLLMAELPSLERTVLLSEPVAETELWSPDVDDGRIVYASLAIGPDGVDIDRGVHLLDLGDPDPTPRRLDESGLAAMPLIEGDTVVWKETDPDFDARNWGQLVRHSLAEGTTEPLDFGPQRQLNYAVMGNRFVGGWGIDSTKLYLYDLADDAPVRIAEFEPTSPRHIVRPHLAGDLLVFIEGYWDPETLERRPLTLKWARLPGPP